MAGLAPEISNQDQDASRVALAILQTLAYADVFDYPLTTAELHRYLVAVRASRGTVESALGNGVLASHQLTCRDGYFALPGRETVIETRRRRSVVAARMWPRAERYGAAIARLPFVRMVAVTGALAVSNVEPHTDIDFLIVTEPGRLWTCRAFVIALTRLAAALGDTICPNYFLSERALLLGERSLFTAHELAQMVPISGLATHRQIARLNATWSRCFLPNACELPSDPRGLAGAIAPVAQEVTSRGSGSSRSLVEATLCGRAGERLERWEMTRKIRKLRADRRLPEGVISTAGDATDVGAGGPGNDVLREDEFCADRCKGHFDRHGYRTLDVFAERLRALGLSLPPLFEPSDGCGAEPQRDLT